jgi:Excalibur calcium-binding domain
MIRIVIVLSVVAGLAGFALPATEAPAQNELDCTDFQFQEEAQEVYDADPSDPNQLDVDLDGIACEELPSSGAAAATATPLSPAATVAAPGTGAGPGDTSETASTLLLVLAGLGALSSVTLLALRRGRS